MVPLPYSISSEYTENITQEMLKLYKQDNLFSLVPFQLAQEQTQTKDKINASNYL
jgi:hypothetical protein